MSVRCSLVAEHGVQRAEWLGNGQRGPDVSPRMGWFPLVTMWQVLLDLPGAGSIPMGYGHLYSAKANLESWAAVTNPPGWTAATSAALATILEQRPPQEHVTGLVRSAPVSAGQRRSAPVSAGQRRSRLRGPC